LVKTAAMARAEVASGWRCCEHQLCPSAFHFGCRCAPVGLAATNRQLPNFGRGAGFFSELLTGVRAWAAGTAPAAGAWLYPPVWLSGHPQGGLLGLWEQFPHQGLDPDGIISHVKRMLA
jgi:hypothetical protein